MTKKPADVKIPSIDRVFAHDASPKDAIPIQLVAQSDSSSSWRNGFSARDLAWLDDTQFKPKAGTRALLPNGDGHLARVLLGLGNGKAGVPCGPSTLLLGKLARSLPPGCYKLDGSEDAAFDAALAWGLGAYRYRKYFNSSKSDETKQAQLCLPPSVDQAAVTNLIEAVWFGRDLINTPASDLGPEELEHACRSLSDRHKARINVIAGDDLLAQNFPLIHTVGRASTRPPRLIEINWSPKTKNSGNLKTLTIIGKGICFDTGGLDVKPPANMLLMKKDMGGAAATLALAHMIMGHNLSYKLQVLIPAAENGIDGNAFRPGDVIRSRSGTTVEIGNTDAEGRLVLADALSYAGEAEPDKIITCATLTGAARVALGPDLPALFTNDDSFATEITEAGLKVGDPLWRMPFWPGYKSYLKSKVADLNNVGSSPLAGAITAALFLNSFVKSKTRYAHVDLYGWRPSNEPLCPIGGDPQAARALFQALRQEVSA